MSIRFYLDLLLLMKLLLCVLQMVTLLCHTHPTVQVSHKKFYTTSLNTLPFILMHSNRRGNKAEKSNLKNNNLTLKINHSFDNSISISIRLSYIIKFSHCFLVNILAVPAETAISIINRPYCKISLTEAL